MEVIRKLVESYFAIVRRTLQDQVRQAGGACVAWSPTLNPKPWGAGWPRACTWVHGCAWVRETCARGCWHVLAVESV